MKSQFFFIILLQIISNLNVNAQVIKEELSKAEKEKQLVELVNRIIDQNRIKDSPCVTLKDQKTTSKILKNTLETKISIEWNQQTIRSVMKDLQNSLKITIVVDRSVSKEELIDFKCVDIKSIHLLNCLLMESKLTGSIKDGMLIIAKAENAPLGNLITKIYPIDDLTNTVKDFPAMDLPGIK